jgi:hypothetical protein
VKARRYLLCLVGLLALLPAIALAGPQVGQVAPNFTLPDTAYVNRQLSDFRGQVVFIMFWAST